MKIGKSIKFYRCLFSSVDGVGNEIIVDEETYVYLSKLPSSKHFHFIAFENQFYEIVERNSDDKLDDLVNPNNWL